MITMGVDIGSLATKAVILKDDRIRAWSIMPSDTGGTKVILEDVLQKAGITAGDVQNVISTGIGKKEADYAGGQASEVICDAAGATFLFPGVSAVIDIGGQSCRAIKCDPEGSVVDFALNDKCAAGTGIFISSMARALEVSPEEMGRLSLESTKDVNISSMCAVFAESEVVSQIHQKVSKVDIIKGIHKSIALRIHGMVNKIQPAEGIVVIGGVAGNIGVVSCLEELIKQKMLIPEEPQITGALGAAIIARERGIAG